jgi:peptidoglycan lytic transglycosylase G
MIAIPKNKKTLLLILLVVVILLAPPAGFAVFLNTPAGDGKTSRVFDFPEGYTLRKFAGDLERGGVIPSGRMLVLYARLRGADARIKAGSYQFTDGISAAEMLRKMVAGEVFAYRFAVPEGYSLYQVAELLESRQLYQKDDFLKQCFDRSLLQELGIGGKSVEGYLYPSTYTIPPAMSAADLIRMMVGQFDRVYGQKFAGREQAAGLTTREVITLASLIEKEAVIPAERPLIASVFRNRLRIGMPLQSDPTAIYGVRAFTGSVTKQDIQRNTPYNTYLIKGLPPGPIGSPGSAAIEAALAPAQTSYLYFVARKDGTHQFSVNLDEHNRAVSRYLR